MAGPLAGRLDRSQAQMNAVLETIVFNIGKNDNCLVVISLSCGIVFKRVFDTKP